MNKLFRQRGWQPAVVVLSLGLFLAGAGRAQAQGAGVRAGASLDPDQFYFGAHVESAPLVGWLRFRPNLEIGLGSNRTLVALNGEFTYRFPISGNDWSWYVGAGPALNLIRLERGPSGDSDTDAEGGFNILLGLEHSRGLFTELKVGALNSPEVKFGVGYTFR